MAEYQFKPGDVVYHKANNLRMVVLEIISNETIRCRFVNAKGEFDVMAFLPVEITLKIPNKVYPQLSASIKD